MGIADFPTEIFKALRCLAEDSAKTRLKLPMSSPPASTQESGLDSKKSLANESMSSIDEQQGRTNTAALTSTEETIDEKITTKQPTSENRNHKELSTGWRSRSGSMAQALMVKPLHLIAAGRDFLHVVNAGVRFPMTLTLSLAKGFHNAPILYGDESVRQSDKITGIPSGLRAAGNVRIVLYYSDGLTGR
jgi:hypothetical protein